MHAETPRIDLLRPFQIERSHLRGRFVRLGELKDLEEAITARRRVVELTPDDDPDASSRLSKLGCLFAERFERQGELGDLEQAIAASRA